MGVCVLVLGKSGISKDSEFREIAGHPNYAVSRDGVVINKKLGHVLKASKNNSGYMVVRLGLGKKGEAKSKYVHRLVAGAFIPNPHCLPAVNHINEDKADNRSSNLEWCDAKYNNAYGDGGKARDSVRKLNCATANKASVARCSKAVINLTTGERFESQMDAARATNVPNSKISAACRGTRKSAGGFKWAFAEVR